MTPGAVSAVTSVVEVAQEAGRRILEVYRGERWEVAEKTDRSPVTRADLDSHHYIVTELNRRTSLPVLSEEDPVDPSVRAGWKEFWLVDPLDGTRDFLHRNDEFTVNIALIREGIPTMGVIHNPALEETFFAERGRGAWVQRRGTDERLPRAEAGGPVGVRSRFHGGDAVEDYFAKLGVTEVIPCGSAIKFCRLAEGVVNLYPRFSGSMEWDIAAGQLLVEESGGTLLAADTGRAPRYNKPSLKSPHFIAFRPPWTVQQILSAL